MSNVATAINSGGQRWNWPNHAATPMAKPTATAVAPAPVKPGLRELTRRFIRELEQDEAVHIAAVEGALTGAQTAAVSLLANDPHSEALKRQALFTNAQVEKFKALKAEASQRLFRLKAECQGYDGEYTRITGEDSGSVRFWQAQLGTWREKLNQIVAQVERQKAARQAVLDEIEAKASERERAYLEFTKCEDEIREHNARGTTLRIRLAQEIDADTKVVLTQAQDAHTKAGEPLTAKNASLKNRLKVLDQSLAYLRTKATKEVPQPMVGMVDQEGARAQVDFAERELKKATDRLAELGEACETVEEPSSQA